MRVEPKALIKRLTPTSTRHLEAAVAHAAGGRFYEIVPEHLLLRMLDEEDADTGYLLAHFQVDRRKLFAHVEKVLLAMRVGNAGRPVFSESLFQWMEDAWLVSSVDDGAARLRSGALFAQFVIGRSRYSAEPFTELEAITADALKKVAADVLASSAESLEAVPPQASGAPASGPAGTGEGALKRFATSFTDKARAGEIDPIFGRHREIRQMVDILSRRRKNNPIIVGEPGVGKTALVEGLALAIVAGDVPESLRNIDLMGLDLGALQAGASVRGEFENRLKAVISEVKASAKPIILFIDEAHTLIGAGGGAGGNDAANLLKPALARGELRTIAATTWAEFKKYFEKDAALERRFQPVKVDEPNEADAVLMLRGVKATYEKAHGVTILDEAVTAAVRLSQRYISGRQLPDKAVDLLDTAAARVKTERASRPDELVALELQLEGMEREKLAHQRDAADGHPVESGDEDLEAKLAATRDSLANLKGRWEAERDAVAALRSARAALAEGKEGEHAELKKAVATAAAAVEKARGEEPLVHAEVDADAVARVVASWTGIPVGKMRSDLIDAILQLETRLTARVRGQSGAIKTVAEVIRIAQAGIRNPETPVGVLLFVGPSGVGKTEMALTLADALYGGERFMTTINMSEFQEKHSVSRLIGSPPGYVGYGEGGVLTEAVRQRPYSVVLLDECEKADLEVMNLFYQVFDKGILNDSEGRSIDFRNTVVILTSNLASDQVMAQFADGKKPSLEEVTAAIRPVLSRHFKPALLARMTIVPFAPIEGDVLRQITQMKLDRLAARLKSSHRIETTFAPELVAELARRSTESETGARTVDHTLRASLMPVLSKEILVKMAEGKVPRRLSVGYSAEGSWSVEFTEP